MAHDRRDPTRAGGRGPEAGAAPGAGGASAGAGPVLETRDCGIAFGGLKAVDGFNLTLEAGELVGLIGPNGAGKTTVFNLITGVYEPAGDSAACA
jgi:ABC-type uncharacterized transport system ATPase subunit